MSSTNCLALLASIVRSRGGALAEARLAAAIFDEAVMQPLVQPLVQPPDPGAELTVKTVDRQEYPMCLPITPRPMAGEEEDTGRAIDTALARVWEAQAEGASLVLSTARRTTSPASSRRPRISSRAGLTVWRHGQAILRAGSVSRKDSFSRSAGHY